MALWYNWSFCFHVQRLPLLCTWSTLSFVTPSNTAYKIQNRRSLADCSAKVSHYYCALLHAPQAMREALKYLAKSKSEDREIRANSINIRINITEKFVMARTLITQNAQQAMAICNELLMTISSDSQVSLMR